MRPTIILFGPETLTAAWIASITSAASIRSPTWVPLLDAGDVVAASDSMQIEPAIDGDGKNQLFVSVLGPKTFRTLALARERFPKLAFAVAENPQAPAADLEAAWADPLAGIVDYRIVRDISVRQGTSFYGAVVGFLESLPLLQ